MSNTAKAFITKLEYVFVLLRVENDLTEYRFVARVHKHIPSAMSIYGYIVTLRLLGTYAMRYIPPKFQTLGSADWSGRR